MRFSVEKASEQEAVHMVLLLENHTKPACEKTHDETVPGVHLVFLSRYQSSPSLQAFTRFAGVSSPALSG